jgi:ribose transport system ATP-binding protein
VSATSKCQSSSARPARAGREMTASDRLALELAAVSKSYTRTQALKDVSLQVRRGEVHALVGGNGSGKSTLIKIIAAVETADSGSITLADREYSMDAYSSDAAHAQGVRVVHQDLGVFPQMTVAENMALGHGFATGFGGRISWRRQRKLTAELLERFEIEASPRARLDRLGQSQQTQLAIARALQGLDGNEHGVLILDEPTASLPDHESQQLLARLRGYASRGEAIIYVSHRLDEVLSVADRVSVLRDGTLVGTFLVSELDEDRLVGLIVGSKLEKIFPDVPAATTSKALLAIEDLSVGPLRGVSLQLSPGEVLGLAGMLGSGRSELLRVVFGDLRPRSGTMQIDGNPYAPRHPADAMAQEIGYVPEDRATSAAFMDRSVMDNISVTRMRGYWRGWIRDRLRKRDSLKLMKKFFVKAGSPCDPLRTLSGGNQQKVIMARWLQSAPRLLLLDEPSQGVDVGARADIYGLVRAASLNGMAALVVVSDFEELARVCDRVLVIRDGAFVAEMSAPNINADQLTQITYGTAGTS